MLPLQQVKRKLEDVARKLEWLYEALRESKVIRTTQHACNIHNSCVTHTICTQHSQMHISRAARTTYAQHELFREVREID